MISQGLIENLVAELIGIVLTVIFVSLFGGYLVRLAQEKAFEKRWRSFRKGAAGTLQHDFDLLMQRVHSFPNDLKLLEAKRAPGDFTLEDLNFFCQKRDDIERQLSRLNDFFERYHFCLREADISLVSQALDQLNATVGHAIAESRQSLNNIEGTLRTHLDGRFDFSQPVRLLGSAGTRFDLFKASVGASIDAFRQMSGIKATAPIAAAVAGLSH